ncbi:MAG: hypothetical protein H7289_07755 [Mucilaginibacter sp.]|nr:hypothetical protein [Mucilaginibacter sp.]
MTEQQLKGLGFVLTESYPHDEFNTNRYKKGVLEVEFTYRGDELITYDLTISEVNSMPITFDELKILSPILGIRGE